MKFLLWFFRDFLDGPLYIIVLIINIILICAGIGYFAEKSQIQKKKKQKFDNNYVSISNPTIQSTNTNNNFVNQDINTNSNVINGNIKNAVTINNNYAPYNNQVTNQNSITSQNINFNNNYVPNNGVTTQNTQGIAANNNQINNNFTK